MNKLLALLLSLAVSCLLFTACDSGGGGGSDGGADVTVVVGLGDSLTSGFGEIPWTTFLRDFIGKPVSNFGSPGRTTGQGLGLVRQAIANNPSHLVVLLGTNDAILSIPTDTAVANLQAIVNVAREQDIRVLLCTLPPIPRSSADNARAEAISGGIRGISGAVRVNLSDLPASAFQADGLHFNNDGARIAAQRIRERL